MGGKANVYFLLEINFSVASFFFVAFILLYIKREKNVRVVSSEQTVLHEKGRSKRDNCRCECSVSFNSQEYIRPREYLSVQWCMSLGGPHFTHAFSLNR